jgi:hypothetical protein
MNAWCARVRPSPPALFGAIVGYGLRSATPFGNGRLTGMMGSGSMKARVGGLVISEACTRLLRPCFASR